MIYLLPTLSCLVGVIFAYRFVRTGRGRLVIWLAAFCAGFAAIGIVLGRAQESGWDAIGYAILVFLGLGPVLIGLGIGSLLGLYALRNRRQKGAHE